MMLHTYAEDIVMMLSDVVFYNTIVVKLIIND